MLVVSGQAFRVWGAREQAFRLRAIAPRGKRGLRGNRGGKVSEGWSGLTHLKVSNHALSPLVPLVPLVPLSVSWRSLGAQLYQLKTNNYICSFRNFFIPLYVHIYR